MQSLGELLTEFKLLFLDIPKITVFDIIDILVTSYLIYKLIIWIRNSRAWSLLKGIVIIFLIGIIALVFQLKTVLWLYSNAISVGIIAIVVVFQPELRRALEKLGSGSLMVKMFTGDENLHEKNSITLEEIDEIVDAVREISQRQLGALIVLEQKVGLGEYEETGIGLDARVKSELLINIFEKNTPLHDGAVIIKNDRIKSATCYLPLSTDEGISKRLGTRHRAAIGISEVSDCVAIIVSEETSAISLVKDGVMIYDIKRESLRNQLITELRRIPINPLKRISIWGRMKYAKKMEK